MLVETIFWFHPCVWWIRARLMEERERACDEEVVRMGSEPQVYAESILKVCEFYLASPAPCAAGVTGGGLKRRCWRWRLSERWPGPSRPVWQERLGANPSRRHCRHLRSLRSNRTTLFLLAAGGIRR
jgi:hypothetical protein